MTISIVRSYITRGGNEANARPMQQAEYLGRVMQSEIFFPYGMHANLPVGSSLLTFSVLGQSSNKISIGSYPEKRKQMKVGEVVFFHPLNGAFIHFKNSAEIDIKSGSTNLTIYKNGKARLLGDLDMTGNLTVNGDTTVNGSTTLNGDTDQNGTLTGTKIITDAGRDLDLHEHDAGAATLLAGGVVPVVGKTGAPI